MKLAFDILLLYNILHCLGLYAFGSRFTFGQWRVYCLRYYYWLMHFDGFVFDSLIQFFIKWQLLLYNIANLVFIYSQYERLPMVDFPHLEFIKAGTARRRDLFSLSLFFPFHLVFYVYWMPFFSVSGRSFFGVEKDAAIIKESEVIVRINC